MNMSPEPEVFFSVMYLKYSNRMLCYSRRCVSSLEDAEDIVSECWISLLKHFPELAAASEDSQAAYIMKTLKHKIIDFQRSKARELCRLVSDFDISLFPCAEPGFDQMTTKSSEIEQMLVQLSPQECMIIQRRISGKTFQKIAEETHTSITKVYRIWKKSGEKIRKKITTEVY